MKPISDSEGKMLLIEAQRLLDEETRKHIEFLTIWRPLKQEYERLHKSVKSEETVCQIVAWEVFKRLRANRKN